MKIISLLPYLIFIPILCFSGNQENNLEWIERNLGVVFDSLEIGEFAGLKGTKIELGVVEGEARGFIKNELIKYLGDLKEGPGNGVVGEILRIEQFHTEIVYQQTSFGFLSLQTGYSRENLVVFSGWIENSKGDILKSFDLKKTVKDSNQVENFSELEKGPYSFTRGKTREFSLWGKIVEPVLITGTVAAMVYLLFSVRS